MSRFQTIKHLNDAGAGKSVKDLFPALVLGYNTGVLQYGKMAADCRKLVADGIDKFADAMLRTIGKLLDNPKSSRMTKRSEEV